MSESKKEAVRAVLPPCRQAPFTFTGAPPGESTMSFKPVSTVGFSASSLPVQPCKPSSVSPPPGISPIADVLPAPVPPVSLRSEVKKEVPKVSVTLGGERPFVPEAIARIKYPGLKSIVASSFKIAAPITTESTTSGEMEISSTVVYLVLGVSLAALGMQIWMLLAAHGAG